MHRYAFIVWLILFSIKTYSYDSIGCEVVKDRKSVQSFQFSKSFYEEDRVKVFTVCSVADAGPHFVVVDLVPTALSTYRTFSSDNLPSAPNKIQDFTTVRETWVSGISDNKYESLKIAFGYIINNNLGDEVNILDAPTWCVQSKDARFCYNAPDYDTQKRDLATFNKVGEMLENIFKTKGANR
ncbi:hypothetical protein [Teredinibacter turnerae]|uniref:hypothetical protein n=1 Tax=Teredinibacter turnerae TaxID=2426 RepID=UPI00048BFF9B|nr:hypothetical protein [Teredinibacter turnerae]